MGTSNYNALQVSLQHKMAHGVQFDFNYTYSKSLDVASDAERVGTISGLGSQVINAWSPNQFYGPSDFDATHQFTANWVVELPFGTGKAIGGGANAVENAFIGGWQLSGLFRLTRVSHSACLMAHSGLLTGTSGNAYLTQPVKTGAYKDPNDPTIVNAFSTRRQMPRARSSNHSRVKLAPETICEGKDSSALTWEFRNAGRCLGAKNRAFSSGWKSSTSPIAYGLMRKASTRRSIAPDRTSAIIHG